METKLNLSNNIKIESKSYIQYFSEKQIFCNKNEVVVTINFYLPTNQFDIFEQYFLYINYRNYFLLLQKINIFL
jgi:hypothetical protein